MLRQKIMEMTENDLMERFRKGIKVQIVFVIISAYNCFGSFPNRTVFGLAVCALVVNAVNLVALRKFYKREQSSNAMVPVIFASLLQFLFSPTNLIIILAFESKTIHGIARLYVANYIIFVVTNSFFTVANFFQWRISILIREKYLCIEAGKADDQGRVFQTCTVNGETSHQNSVRIDDN